MSDECGAEVRMVGGGKFRCTRLESHRGEHRTIVIGLDGRTPVQIAWPRQKSEDREVRAKELVGS